jgi:hypothetical protein
MTLEAAFSVGRRAFSAVLPACIPLQCKQASAQHDHVSCLLVTYSLATCNCGHHNLLIAFCNCGCLRSASCTLCRARFRLVVPFNGTDGSGLARCYAHVGLRDGQKNSSYPAARWQEAGGYNTTCGPTSLDRLPFTDQVRVMPQKGGIHAGSTSASRHPALSVQQSSHTGQAAEQQCLLYLAAQTVNSCANAGAPTNVTNLEACTRITSTNTCAQQKYGADTPRSCGFTGQDILFSFAGFSSMQEAQSFGNAGR